MKIIYILSALLFLSLSAKSEILDRIVGVVDGKIITLSQVKRVKESLSIRKQISPVIYVEGSDTITKLTEIVQRRFLIRSRLDEMGYIVTDDQVETQIKATEERLNLTRNALLQFLKGNGSSFSEYFEIIRESIEFNIFYGQVIQPLISVSNQEIKNEYFRQNTNNKAMAFNYYLIAFTLPKDKVSKQSLDTMTSNIKKFQQSGVLDKSIDGLDTIDFGNISQDGLTPAIARSIKNVHEGELSRPVLIGDNYHVFFVKKKDLKESQDFIEKKPLIIAKIREQKARQAISLWVDRQKNLRYTRTFN